MDWIEIKKASHQIKDSIWVECIAEIRNNETGEIRRYSTDEILATGEDHPSVFIWKEGNFACDCNRLLFFKRANQEESDEDWDEQCSDGKFSVNLINAANGMYYYREFKTESLSPPLPRPASD